MARYSDAVCRLCRREGMKLYLKGERCFKEKCSFETRKGKIPGQHGAAKAKKPTGYALQLREKQKVKRIYGVLEKQFSLYFKRADAKKGVTGHNLLAFLESRLDNVVFRLGFCPSRAAARQMVMHGHILVNGKRVDIPSLPDQVRPDHRGLGARPAERLRQVLPGNRGWPRDSPVAHARCRRLQGLGDRGSPRGKMCLLTSMSS